MMEPRNETELGELPASWHVGPLGEFLSKAQYGASVKGDASGGCPILRMTNQVNGRISPANIQYADISVHELENFRVQRGTGKDRAGELRGSTNKHC
jgi:type I restriction enzyme, S subunit